MRQVPFPASFCIWHPCPRPIPSGGRSQSLTECSSRFNICHESTVGRRGRDASRRHDFSGRVSGQSSKEDFQKPRSVQRLLLLLQEEAAATALARVPVASLGFSTSQQHRGSLSCLSFPLNVAPNPANPANRNQNPNLKRSLGNVVLVFLLCTPEVGVGDESVPELFYMHHDIRNRRSP